MKDELKRTCGAVKVVLLFGGPLGGFGVRDVVKVVSMSGEQSDVLVAGT